MNKVIYFKGQSALPLPVPSNHLKPKLFFSLLLLLLSLGDTATAALDVHVVTRYPP